MIAIAEGLVLFFSQMQLPAIFAKTLDFCAGLNTPLAMFAVGVYLAQCRFGKMLKKRKAVCNLRCSLAVNPVDCAGPAHGHPGDQQRYPLRGADRRSVPGRLQPCGVCSTAQQGLYLCGRDGRSIYTAVYHHDSTVSSISKRNLVISHIEK